MFQEEDYSFSAGLVAWLICPLAMLTQHEDGFLDLETTVSAQNRFLDSYVSKSQTPAFTILDGLDHLEGKTVQVVADGAVHP